MILDLQLSLKIPHRTHINRHIYFATGMEASDGSIIIMNFMLLLLLPRDASAERGDEIACRMSVCPSVRL